MFARIGRWSGAFSVSTCLILSIPAAARAATVPLTLDTSFTGATGKTIEDEPDSLRDCSAFPDGAKIDSDGWKFDQPVPGGTVQAYTIALIKTVNGVPEPVLLGITSAGVVRIAFNPATAQGQFGPDDLGPAPEGVTGGLADDGAWLNTPAGWRLAFGALMVTGGAAGGGTFALTDVCLPAPAASPSVSAPSASRSVSPSASATSASPTTTAAAAATETGGSLPITGSRTGPLALAGLALAIAGVLLLAVRRRRIRFRA